MKTSTIKISKGRMLVHNIRVDYKIYEKCSAMLRISEGATTGEMLAYDRTHSPINESTWN